MTSAPVRTSTRDARTPLAPAAPVRIPPRHHVTTERLELRPLVASDAKEFLRVLGVSRGHIERWFPLNLNGETDTEYFERQVRRAAESDAERSAWRRAAFDDDGRLVGIVNVNRIERGLNWQADVCWWVAADRVRRGYGLELVQAACDHALGDLPFGLGLHALHAGIHPDNTPCLGLIERLGFRRDPDHESRLYVDGSWQHHQAWVKAV